MDGRLKGKIGKQQEKRQSVRPEERWTRANGCDCGEGSCTITKRIMNPLMMRPQLNEYACRSVVIKKKVHFTKRGEQQESR